MGKLMGMAIFSGSALTPLWCTFVKILSFTILAQRDKSNWPRCLSGMVACRLWLILVVAPPWAETAEDIATSRLEGDVLRERVPAQGMDGRLTVSGVPQCPNVWTDGSLVSDDLVGFVVGGGIWTCYPMILSLVLNGVLRTLLCLGLCRLFNGLRCGR